MKSFIKTGILRLWHSQRVWLALAWLALGAGLSGCATTSDEPENLSSKPWNSPEGYQNGNLPSNMFH